MKPISKILWRDLWHLRGQLTAAALVVACGVMAQVCMHSAYISLKATQEKYYDRYRFAAVFASLKRAPESLAGVIGALPGVAQVQTRVIVDATLDIPGLAEPASGRLVSIPERQVPMINDIYLRRGRYIEASQPDGVLISEVFAQANKLDVGDKLGAILNGRRRELTVVGIALSPEYIYEVGPGMLFPDNRRFGVLWMGRESLATAFNMQGAFNDVSLTLTPHSFNKGAEEVEVIAGLDRLLSAYGGLGAYDRKDQLSNRFLSDELAEIRVSATYIPAIFLTVAVFLIYIVLSRLVVMQRTQIGLLKAFGYSSASVALHYLKFSLVTVLSGLLPGLLLGLYLGQLVTNLYQEYFHFPLLELVVSPEVILGAALVNLTGACAGATAAAKRVAAITPAEAMRPEAPTNFRAGVFERSGVAVWLPTSARMILRNLARKPWKALLTVLGIGIAVGLMMVTRFMLDAVDHMMTVQFDLVQRDDVTILFHEPRAASAIFGIRQLPGVLRAEPFRAVPVRLRHEHRSKQIALTGLANDSELHQIIDSQLRVTKVPAEGLMLTRKLGEILGVTTGDNLTLEVLEGSRQIRQVAVAGLSDELIGIGAYMDAGALAQLLGEDNLISGARLRVDPAYAETLFSRLKRIPAVSGVAIRSAMLGSVKQIIDRAFLQVSLVEMLFAAIIVGGMVYNSVRISLSERGNELASLRVLGFTQREIMVMLMGEQALLTLLAIPVGMVMGYGMSAALVPIFDREMFRIPLVFGVKSFTYPVIATLVAAMLSALLVARRLRHLDLIAVLKTRE
ncbi:MAG: FtsX-like permease family protein [Rhodocyclaceae bacterium]|nr:FtsX-like permease family protein [Rhodocyclaceae bacterium]MCA3082241.1 FtsX-like permease family protein [Rhodocyclaceae bacterium]